MAVYDALRLLQNMTQISGIDRVVFILRQRLEARERAQKKQSSAASAGEQSQQPVGVEALLQAQGVNEKVLRRAFVQSLLSDHFGQNLLNDAKFQQVVDQVNQTIAADPTADRLLGRLIGELQNRFDRTHPISPDASGSDRP